MSSVGRPTVPNTISIVTKAALGILATPMLVAVEARLSLQLKIKLEKNKSLINSFVSYQIATNCPIDKETPFNCAIKIVATH